MANSRLNLGLVILQEPLGNGAGSLGVSRSDVRAEQIRPLLWRHIHADIGMGTSPVTGSIGRWSPQTSLHHTRLESI